MCGRITMTNPDLDALGGASWGGGATWGASALRARYNIAPAQRHWIVRAAAGASEGELVEATWGLRNREGRLLINLRAETLSQPAGRLARASRCAVPADGFYEWVGTKVDRRPLWFHAPEGGSLWMAGVYDAQEGLSPAFAVLTCPANRLVAQAHDRMPVLLDEDALAEWLDRDTPEVALRSMLRPAPVEALEVHPASTRVNIVANDDPGCIEPPRGPAQLALF